MSEPGEGQKPPVEATLTSDSGEGDFRLTIEQEMALKKSEARKLLVKPLIDRIVPDPPGFRVQDRAHKRVLIDKIAETKIPDDDLDEYISVVHGIGTTLFSIKDIPQNKAIEASLLTSFVSPSESLDQARINLQLAQQWRDRFMISAGKEGLQRAQVFATLLTELTGVNVYPRPEPKSPEQITQLFQGFMEVYDYFYSLPKDKQHDYLVRRFVNSAKEVGLESNDPNQTRRLLQLFKEVADYPERKTLDSFTDAAERYANHHGLTEDAIRGLVDKLLPALAKKDPQVAILNKSGNIWAMRDGEFGAAEFLCHTYASRVTPANINGLFMATREVATTTLAKLEQNRIDAPSVDSSLRELVHDQRPYTHDLINAMVSFYDTGDKKQLEEAIQRGREYEKDSYSYQFDHLSERVFDKSFYEREVKVEEEEDMPENAIDVLKRLAENTKPIEEIPPVTSDTHLNERLNLLTPEHLGSILDYVNGQLLEMMQRGEIGIEPNYVLALAWIERKVFEVLQGMKHEDQLGAYKTDLFASILKFQELTASPNIFDDEEFRSFLERVRNTQSSQDAYKLVAERTLENANGLAQKYKKQGRQNTGTLWSGNTTHELIGLIDPRPAMTEQGRKAVKEANLRVTEPSYHPGD